MPTKTFTVYGRDDCPFCVKATAHLAQRNMAYDYLNTTQNPTHLKDLKRRLPTATTLPQIFVGQEYIGGFTELVALPISALQAKVGGS